MLFPSEANMTETLDQWSKNAAEGKGLLGYSVNSSIYHLIGIRSSKSKKRVLKIKIELMNLYTLVKLSCFYKIKAKISLIYLECVVIDLSKNVKLFLTCNFKKEFKVTIFHATQERNIHPPSWEEGLCLSDLILILIWYE